MGVDKVKLVAFLEQREAVKNPVVGAIHQGLRERVLRGDFDDGSDA